jgi:hypothetical protein
MSKKIENEDLKEYEDTIATICLYGACAFIIILGFVSACVSLCMQDE